MFGECIERLFHTGFVIYSRARSQARKKRSPKTVTGEESVRIGASNEPIVGNRAIWTAGDL